MLAHPRTTTPRQWAILVATLAAAALLLPPSYASALGPAPPADPPSPLTAQSDVDTGRLLVKIDTPATVASLRRALEDATVRLVDRVDGLGVLVVEVQGDPERARQRLEASHAVAYAEAEGVAHAVGRAPNDPIYPLQWGLPRIDLPSAWSTTVGDPSVTIAVLDTGVDESHEDLEGAVTAGRDFVGDDASVDAHGHGTLSAGVAAARADNLRGVAGACWECGILAVRVLDEDGQGTVADVSAGIRYAAEEGADVIALSLGRARPSNTLALAVNDAVARGSLVIAAAGNEGATDEFYPAAYDNVVGVAGSRENDARYSWSNHGPWVSLAAPGCNVSTTNDASDRYGWYCGTSSAAPLAAGVAGLAFAHDPDATNADVRAALRTAAEPVSYVAHGRLDAAGTLAALDAGSTEGPLPENETDERPDSSPDEQGPVVADRVAGVDRFDTAARASSGTFEPGVRRAYIATSASFPDALAAGPAAAAKDGPVLLTAPGTLPEATERELVRLAPEEVVVVGGGNAVSDDVLSEIEESTGARPLRVAGTNRYETAAAVAGEAFPEGSEAAYVATGLGFADALSATPAAAVDGAPLLLTEPDRLPDATRDRLRALAPERIVLLGGHAVVGSGPEEELSAIAPVVRVAGGDRFGTSARIAARAYPEEAAIGVLATGDDHPDALAGGAVAAHIGGPLLLVRQDELPEAAAGALQAGAPPQVLALGGVGVIDDATLEAARDAAEDGRTQAR